MGRTRREIINMYTRGHTHKICLPKTSVIHIIRATRFTNQDRKNSNNYDVEPRIQLSIYAYLYTHRKQALNGMLADNFC